ncbi:hypothetical protein N9Y00_07095 [Tateyamaria sp.]|nr:hypothetical protein [Tateyamaria sp.]
MTAEEILNLPGVVVRKMPTVNVSRWRHWVQHHGEPRNTETRTVIAGPDEKGLYIVEERKPVSPKLAGKFLVTFVSGTGNMVRFDAKSEGVGDTIPEAYANIKRRVILET